MTNQAQIDRINEMKIAAEKAAVAATTKGKEFRGAFEFCKELGYYENDAERSYFCAIFVANLPKEILIDANNINI